MFAHVHNVINPNITVTSLLFRSMVRNAVRWCTLRVNVHDRIRFPTTPIRSKFSARPALLSADHQSRPELCINNICFLVI